jgi:hypothetical protein
LHTKYQTTALKAIFRLDLPYKVEDRIEYLSVQDVDGAWISLLSWSSTTTLTILRLSVGFAYSQPDEDST